MSLLQHLYHFFDHRDDASNDDAHNGLSTREVRQAMRDLQALSDRELHELGISRCGIRDAVIHGRPQDQDVANPNVAA